MHLLVVSYFAGVLTVAAPCVLPLLPVIVGGSITVENSKARWWRPLAIAASLAGSVIIFTLLLKATTSLLGVPQIVWNTISGVIVLLFGLTMLFPHLWEWFALKSRLYEQSTKLMQQTGRTHPGLGKDILLGASLGPVFSSCNPTYALIVAVVLPASFYQGFVYLVAYALGLASILLLIAIAGQSLVRRLGWLSNPSGMFRKVVGVLFIIVGLAVLTGLDRNFQSYVLEQGWYDPIMKIEQKLE
jgi:cytochrome c-type biogenesis protein